MRTRPEVSLTTGRHVRARATGEIGLKLSGPAGCRGTVTLRSDRRIASRWLERGRPRAVTLGRRPFALAADGRAEVTLRLSPEHVALLRRMGSMRAVARVATAESRTARAVTVHAPARRRSARRPAARATGAAIVLLMACAPAASARWSPPDRLSSPAADLAHRPAGTPTLAIDARGTALATWARTSGGRRLARRPAGASLFGAEGTAPRLGDEVIEREPPAPLAYGSGRTLALEQRPIRRTSGGFVTRYALVARTGARLARARALTTICTHRLPPPLALAGNRGGTAVAAWIEDPRDARGRCDTDRPELLRVAVHRPRGGFGTPITLRRGVGSPLLAAAVGARGDVLVAIRRKGALEIFSRGPSGRWSAARRFPVADPGVDALRAAIGPRGAWLLWSSTRNGIRTVSTAFRRPHATHFGPAHILERDAWPGELIDSPDRWRLRIAAPERGAGATAAWTGWDGAHQRVMVAYARGDEPLPAPAAITPSGEDHVLGDLALGAGRRAVAVVSRPAGGPELPQVALARGAAPFGALEPVGEGQERIGGEAIALDPVTTRPTLVWTEVRVAATGPVTTVFASTRRQAR